MSTHELIKEIGKKIITKLEEINDRKDVTNAELRKINAKLHELEILGTNIMAIQAGNMKDTKDWKLDEKDLREAAE